MSKKLNNNNIIKYTGPGICKSDNVYKGIEMSSGEIIVIYDADLTVSFNDIEFAIKILLFDICLLNVKNEASLLLF